MLDNCFSGLDEFVVEFVGRAHILRDCLILENKSIPLLPINVISRDLNEYIRCPLLSTHTAAKILVKSGKADYGALPDDEKLCANELLMSVIMSTQQSDAYRRQYLPTTRRRSIKSSPSPLTAKLGTPLHVYSEESKAYRYSRKVFIGAVQSHNFVRVELREILCTLGVVINFHQPRCNSTRNEEDCANYVFCVFLEERSVHRLVDKCRSDGDNQLMLYLPMCAQSVHVRVWDLADNQFIHHHSLFSHASLTQWTIHVDGLPRPFRAVDVRQALAGAGIENIVYVGLETDLNRSMACQPIGQQWMTQHTQPHMLVHYPRVAARVQLGTAADYNHALMHVQKVHIDANKTRATLMLRPYVAHGGSVMCSDCATSAATLYCAHVTCLQYYCRACFTNVHTKMLNGEQYNVVHGCVDIIANVGRVDELPCYAHVDHSINTYSLVNRAHKHNGTRYFAPMRQFHPRA